MENEDVVAKHKRLLSMAKTSLEANQRIINEKDKKIAELATALEEYKKPNRHGINLEDDGVPLRVPEKCLSAEESFQIQTECKKKVERIVEEFRRFKVRSEIARQQKDKEFEFLHNAPKGGNGSLTTDAYSRPSMSIERIMTESAAGFSAGNGPRMPVVSVTASLEAEVGKWKAAYEQAVRENEQLRSSGGMLLSTGGRDSLDAAEWRDRFESCLAEKQALLERVDMLTGGAGRTGRGRLTAPDGGEGQAPSKSVEKAYLALREEYKEFRRKVLELEQEREKRRDRRRRDEAEGGGASCVSEEIAGSSGSSSRTRRRAGGDGAEASKLQYVRHLILQYLSCKEPVLRDHMEQAIVTIFRFNDRERERILERKKEENPEEAVLSSVRSIVNTLGMNY